MRRVVIAFLLAASAACSNENQGESAERQTADAAESAVVASKACDVLTLADARMALGREHDVEQLDADGGPAGLDICQYGYQGEAMLDTGNVSVTVQPIDLASVKAGAEEQGYKLEPVIGVGDAAYYSPDIGLYVGKGNRTAIYLLAANGMTDARERSITLARATVSRL
jgi:hypothetical protein